MTSPYETPLVDLMDNVAMAAMEQFIALYAPEKTEGPDATVQWCNHIAGMSYAMAGAMINTRSKLHSDMIANAQKFRKNDSNGFWTRSKLHSDMIANAQKEEANEA